MLSLGVPAAAAARGAAALAHRRSQVRRSPSHRWPARGTARETSASDASHASGPPLAPSNDFLRLTRERGASEASLQTSVVTLECRTPDGATEPLRVELVSVVHVGDETYYNTLQERLSTYDRVLYELIVNIPPEKPGHRWRPPPPSRRRTFRNPVAFAQRFIGSVLQLELQLENLDYSHEHWYHADLELSQFLQLQRKRDESWPKLLWRALQAEMAREVAESDAADGNGVPTWKRLLKWSQDRLPLPMVFQLVVAGALEQAEDRPLSRSPVVGSFLNLDIPSGLKLILAEQLASDSVFTSGVLRSSVLVAERNIAAVAAVRQAMQAGTRRVAVLYGSAHMPDMERRLLEELGMQRVATTWVDAWRVPLSRVEPSTLRLQRRQAAALGAFSLLLATDLSLWEQIYAWSGHAAGDMLMVLLPQLHML